MADLAEKLRYRTRATAAGRHPAARMIVPMDGGRPGGARLAIAEFEPADRVGEPQRSRWVDWTTIGHEDGRTDVGRLASE